MRARVPAYNSSRPYATVIYTPTRVSGLSSGDVFTALAADGNMYEKDRMLEGTGSLANSILPGNARTPP